MSNKKNAGTRLASGSSRQRKSGLPCRRCVSFFSPISLLSVRAIPSRIRVGRVIAAIISTMNKRTETSRLARVVEAGLSVSARTEIPPLPRSLTPPRTFFGDFGDSEGGTVFCVFFFFFFCEKRRRARAGEIDGVRLSLTHTERECMF